MDAMMSVVRRLASSSRSRSFSTTTVQFSAVPNRPLTSTMTCVFASALSVDSAVMPSPVSCAAGRHICRAQRE